MKKDHYCIIMAGGVGSRFWPLSRKNKPKQFLDILGVGKTLLQLTYDRFKDIFSEKNIYVVTSAEHGPLVKRQLPGLPKKQILLEPFRKKLETSYSRLTNPLELGPWAEDGESQWREFLMDHDK